MKTPEYLSDLSEIIVINDEIIQLRNTALRKFGIDLLSTDNSRKLIVGKVLSGFNPRFKRNGVDRLYNDREVELKTAKTESCNAGFMFHVMGDIFHKQHLFIVLDETLNVLRHYVIDNPNSVAIMNNLLQKRKIEYLEEHHGKVAKRDVITITENEIVSALKG